MTSAGALRGHELLEAEKRNLVFPDHELLAAGTGGTKRDPGRTAQGIDGDRGTTEGRHAL
jgi:hypothetical protein